MKLIVIGSVMSDTRADIPCAVQPDNSGFTECNPGTLTARKQWQP